MRILVLGDTHIGQSPDLGPPGERLKDQERVLERIVEIAEEQEVDAVLFAGDLCEHRKPSPAELLVAQRFVEGIGDDQVFGICGNHDVSHADDPIALDLFADQWGIARGPAIFHPRHSGVEIAALPWTPVSRLVAAMPDVERDQVNQRAAEILLDTARGLRAQMDASATKILLAHWSVSGASFPNGLPVEMAREVVLPLADLEAIGFDAIVLGHIHLPQTLGLAIDSPLVYVGSPMPLNFGEAGTEHGVFILDTDEKPNCLPRFIPIESRPLVTLEADLTSPDTSGLAYVDLGYAEKEQPVDGAIVRVRYTASEEQSRRVDHAEIRRALLDAGAHWVTPIQATIVRPERSRVSDMDETLDELAALEMYCRATWDEEFLAGERYAAMVGRTQELLRGLA